MNRLFNYRVTLKFLQRSRWIHACSEYIHLMNVVCFLLSVPYKYTHTQCTKRLLDSRNLAEATIIIFEIMVIFFLYSLCVRARVLSLCLRSAYIHMHSDTWAQMNRNTHNIHDARHKIIQSSLLLVLDLC